jgi:hypothetical protein
MSKDIRLLQVHGDEMFTLRGLRALGSQDVSAADYAYRDVPHRVIVSRENYRPDGIPDWRWHVSVSGMGRLPDWRAFVALVHHVRPGVVFCVGVPPPNQWINVNPNVLHAFEIHDRTLTDQWRMEGRGDEPT